MEIDVNLRKPTVASNGLELKTISAGSYSSSCSSNSHNNSHNNQNHHHYHNNNNNNTATSSAAVASTSSSTPNPPSGCCGILTRLLCSTGARGKTATSSCDYNSHNNACTPLALYGGSGNNGCTSSTSATSSSSASQHNSSSYMNLLKKNHTHRRTPQEIYFESRGKSCKKLLKFNGNSNKVSEKIDT